jgi:DNA-3-methyladenine glycosylase II
MVQILFPNDPKMQTLYERVLAHHQEIPTIIPKPPEGYFADLVEQIIGQQLSALAADKIIARVKEAQGGSFIPEMVLETPLEAFRNLGTSNAKASYIRNIADAFINNAFEYRKFPEMLDDDVIGELIKIKGVGRWTAEMFLIFTMGRPDVFSVGDLALRKATMQLYSLKTEPKPDKFLQLARKWSPQRSLASRVLWRSLDTKGLAAA